MKAIVTTGLLLTALPGMAQLGGKYSVKGSFDQPTATAAKLYLRYRTWWAPENVQQLDSASVVDGQFEFTGTIKQPLEAEMILAKNGEPFYQSHDRKMIYLEQGHISMSFKDSLKYATVSGAPANDEQPQYAAAMQPLTNRRNQLNEAFKKANAENRLTPAFQAENKSRYEALVKEETAAKKRFISQHPDSYFSYIAFKDVVGRITDTTIVGPLFKKLSPRLRQLPEAKYYRDIFTTAYSTAIGAQAPVFTGTDTSGKTVSLSDYKGQYVLVDFWASWCGPCKAEMPNVIAVWKKYHARNFTVLSVSGDNAATQNYCLQIIRSQHLTWTHLFDGENKIGALYGVFSIPQNFLLNPEGKIVAINLRGDALEMQVASRIL